MPPKKEFSALSMVMTLIVVCSLAALALAAVSEITRAPIAEAKRRKKLEAIQYVLPQKAQPDGVKTPPEPLFANNPSADALIVKLDGDSEIEVYPARDAEGKFIALAIPISDPKGYGGQIKMMIGLDASGKVIRISLLEHKETPGLGDAIGKDKFLGPLLAQDAQSLVWKVKKDKGGVDAITAATISSRAALRAISSAFVIFETAKSQYKLGEPTP